MICTCILLCEKQVGGFAIALASLGGIRLHVEYALGVAGGGGYDGRTLVVLIAAGRLM